MHFVYRFWLLGISFACSAANAQVPELVLQQGHTASINAISFSSNGRYILSVSADQTAKIWDPFNARLITHLKVSAQSLDHAFFSPNSKYVLTYGESNTETEGFHFSDPATGKLLYTIHKQNGHVVNNVEISPNGELSAATYESVNEIWLYHANTGKLWKKINGLSQSKTEEPHFWKFASDSTLLIGSYRSVPKSDNRRLVYYVYNINTEKIISSIPVPKIPEMPEYYQQEMVMSHSGRYFLHAGRDHSTYRDYTELWDIQNKKMIWRKHAEAVTMDFNADDSKLMLGTFPESDNDTSQNGKIVYPILLEISPSDPNYVYQLKNEGLHCYSSKGNLIATSYSDSGLTDKNETAAHKISKIGIWNKAHELISECRLENELSAIAFSRDEKYFVTGYKNGNFSVWDITNPVAKLVTETENQFDPIKMVHADPSSNKMLYLTKNIYGTREENTLNKPIYFTVPENVDPKVIFFNRDSLSIIKSGKDLMLVSNDSLAVLAEIKADQMKNSGVEKLVHFRELQTFGIYSKPIVNKTDGTPFVDTENYKPVPGYFLFGSVKGVKKSFSIPLSINIKYQSIRRFNDSLNSYLSPFGHNLFTVSETNKVVVQQKINTLDLQRKAVTNHEKYLLGRKKTGTDRFAEEDAFIYCVDLNNHTKFTTPARFKNDSIGIPDIAIFSPDEKTMALASEETNDVRIINGNTGQALYNLAGHTSKISGLDYSKDGKYLYSWSEDGTAKKWNVASGQNVYTLIFLKDHDYAIILPNSYYYISSRTDAKYLNFKLNNRLYNFSQFDIRFNRPDKVLEALGSTDTGLIKAYHDAWLVRAQKSGFTETALNSKSLHVPDVSVNLNSLPSITKQKEIKIEFVLEDSLYKIGSYNIFINNVPVNGINGKKIAGPSKKIISGQLLTLSEGLNKIELNCTNEKGVESRKETVYVNYEPEQAARPKTFFIGIGINQYERYSKFKNLSYCVKDIRDLVNALKEKFTNDLIIDTLLDFAATKENIGKLRQKLLQTGIEDRVIISFSGHGMVDSRDNEFYFVTGNTDVNNPSVNGIAYSTLEEFLDSIPARKKLLLLDACHSGESNEYQLAKLNGVPGTRGYEDSVTTISKRQIELTEVKQEKPAIKPFDVFKLMKDAFVDIRRNNGAYVISAAQSNESALEKGSFSNGVFTHCLLEQLRTKASLRINDLSMLINQCVHESTKGQQNIANRQELADYNWTLW